MVWAAKSSNNNHSSQDTFLEFSTQRSKKEICSLSASSTQTASTELQMFIQRMVRATNYCYMPRTAFLHFQFLWGTQNQYGLALASRRMITVFTDKTVALFCFCNKKGCCTCISIKGVCFLFESASVKGTKRATCVTFNFSNLKNNPQKNFKAKKLRFPVCHKKEDTTLRVH